MNPASRLILAVTGVMVVVVVVVYGGVRYTIFSIQSVICMLLDCLVFLESANNPTVQSQHECVENIRVASFMDDQLR